MNEITLKRLLLARVFELRRNQFTYESLDKAQSVQDDMITVDGAQVKRRRVVLTAHGCKVATCTMCPLPDEAVSPKISVTLDHWLAQIKAAIGPEDDIHTLTLFHNGNYFSEREVPSVWRMAIHDYLRTQTRIKHLVVESLPQYIKDDVMFETAMSLRVGRSDGGIKLIVAIGLQSSSELVRELCIASTCLDDSFQRAIKSLRDFGFDAQVFLMFHPPFLSIEESVHDLRESIRYCHSFGVTPTICPMRIASHTVVDDLAKRDLYQAPDLWDLYDALHEMEPVRVAASLFPKDADSGVLTAFDMLNHTGKLIGIKPSPPHKRHEPVEPRREVVLGRIRHYLTLDSATQVGETW